MTNFVLRKDMKSFSNWLFDDFMQRAVKATGSLKNKAFSNYVLEFQKSVSAFQQLRKTTSASAFTEEIRNLSIQADKVFRKIKAAVDYSALWSSGAELETAKTVTKTLSIYGGITRFGMRRRFVDYEALIIELKKDPKIATTLKLDAVLKELSQVTIKYREAHANRDKYRAELKGKRREARQKAQESYLTLRDKVEAFAEINGMTDVSEFVKLVNEALIYLCPNVSPKKEVES